MDAEIQRVTDAPAGIPVTVVGPINAAGVSATASPSDHQHRLEVQVQDEGVLTASRPTLDFVGGGVTVTDDGGGDRAIVTIPAGVALGGPPVTVVGATNSDGVAATASHSDHQHRLEVQVQDEGVLTASRPTLNFVGAGVTVTDDGGGDRATVTIPGVADTDRIGYFFGANSVASTADTRFIPPGRESGTAPLSNNGQLPVTRAGTLRNLGVRHNSAPGNANTVVYTVMVNGVATAITVSLAANAVATANDLANTAAVVAGDRVSLQAVKAASIAAGAVDVEATLELVF